MARVDRYAGRHPGIGKGGLDRRRGLPGQRVADDGHGRPRVPHDLAGSGP